MRGPSRTCHGTRLSWLAPTPQTWTPPSSSGVWSLRFLLVRVHHRLLGAGRWVWVDERGVVHLDKPLRLGVVNGSWGWQRELPGPREGMRGCAPPPPKWG